MTAPLIPDERLARAGKILFITHLALGDYTYLQNCFKAFAEAYPHIRIHLWVDEVRRTSDASKWEQLKNYSLYDWVAACPFFDKVYQRTYSPELLRESIREAQAEKYDVVVSLAVVRPHRYASMAREISASGFVAGIGTRMNLFQTLLQPHHRRALDRLDARISPYSANIDEPAHISDIYAGWFRQLFGLDIPPEKRFPFVEIPVDWLQYAAKQIGRWGVNKHDSKLIFLNPFAKTRKRCWPLERIADLVNAMRREAAWRDAFFIVNAVPSELGNVKKMIATHGLARTEAFSAEDNFFQLPAVLSQCDLAISVETAVMHLANAVHVPVIALMRKKNPEWVPIDRKNSIVITTARRSAWVKDIPVNDVMEALKGLPCTRAD
ncbi:MAG: glycosyltransferase family 9 protein [Burkholderiaceae bacterium]